MDNGTRGELLSRLAEAVGSITTAHPTRVAVDGPPAAGKTTLADELADVLRAQGREVIRASIDCFLFPRSQRYRRGEYSAEACYHDSFDYDALHRVLLDPLGPGGDRRFQQGVFDYHTDTALSQPLTTAPADAVLLLPALQAASVRPSGRLIDSYRCGEGRFSFSPTDWRSPLLAPDSP
jgi:uridine kinase